jgi:hypothetical protein
MLQLSYRFSLAFLVIGEQQHYGCVQLVELTVDFRVQLVKLSVDFLSIFSAADFYFFCPFF